MRNLGNRLKGGCTGLKGFFVLIILLAVVFLPQAYSYGEPDQGTFLSVTDLHFNPFADPSLVDELAKADYTKWGEILDKSKTGGLGAFGQDAPYGLVKSSFEAMKKDSPKPDFILFSGDFLSHHFRSSFDATATVKGDEAYKSFVKKTMQFLAFMFESEFPSAPVIPTLGNNDTDCDDYEIDPGGSFLKMYAGVWGPRIERGDERSFLETLSSAGYYMVPNPVVKNSSIVVLNGDFLSSRYTGKCAEKPKDYANEMLEWLADTLSKSEAAKAKVWLMIHEPPGVDIFATLKNGANGACSDSTALMLKEDSNTRLLDLLKKYSSTVQAVFSGHTHMDNFELVFKDGVPVVWCHITPSVSPVFGNVPAFQEFYYDRGTGEATDYVTYYLKGFPDPASTWQQEYDYKKSYWNSRYSVPELGLVYDSIFPDGAIRNEYVTHFAGGNTESFDDGRWKAYWCGIGNLDKASFSNCWCGK